MFVPTRSRPLARSVAHSQLRVLRGALVMSAVSRTVSNLRRLIGQKVPFNAVAIATIPCKYVDESSPNTNQWASATRRSVVLTQYRRVTDGRQTDEQRNR